MAHMPTGRVANLLPVVIVLGLAGQAAAENFSLADIVDGLKMRSHSLHTVSADLNGVCYRMAGSEQLGAQSAQTVVLRMVYRVVAKGSKLKIAHDYLDKDNPDNPPKRTNWITWDGVKTRGYVSGWDSGDYPKSGGLVVAGRSNSLHVAHYLSAIERDTLELEGPLESHIDPERWSIEGVERIGARPAVHLSGPVAVRPGARLHAWVAVEHGFCPIRLKLVNRVGEHVLVQEMKDVELERIAGTWVRKRSKTFVNNPAVGPGWWVYDYSVQNTKLGFDVSDSEFILRFPSGMVVFDKTTMMASIVGEDGQLVPKVYRGDGWSVDMPENEDLAHLGVGGDVPSASAQEGRRAASEDVNGESLLQVDVPRKMERDRRRAQWPVLGGTGVVIALLVGALVYVTRRRNKQHVA